MRRRAWIGVAVAVPLCIAVVVLQIALFRDRQYAVASAILALLACVPFFVDYERKRPMAAELVTVAVCIALTVLGRVAFSFVPFFKPVTAIVVLCAAWMGGGSGFLIGALSALLSNFYFGQGPWTPFQMLTWGMIGLVSGLLGKRLVTRWWMLIPVGLMAGVAYSCVMDVWTVLALGEGFSVGAYGAVFVTSLPVMATYTASNVVFLLALYRPLGRTFERLFTKYGLFGGDKGSACCCDTTTVGQRGASISDEKDQDGQAVKKTDGQIQQNTDAE